MTTRPATHLSPRLWAPVSAAARWSAARARLRPLSLLVLAVLVAATLATFAVALHLVDEQEERTLRPAGR